MPRRIAFVLLVGLALCVIGQAAHADEEAEGRGFSFRLPAGFEIQYDSTDADTPFNGGMVVPEFSMAGLGKAVDSEMKVYLRGTGSEPGGAIIVVAGGLAESTNRISQADLSRVREATSRSLGEDVDTEVRRATGPDGREALEVSFDLSQVASARGLEGHAWLLAVPADDYAVMILYMNLDPERAFEAETEWRAIQGSLKIDPPTTPKEALIYALIGAAVLGVLYVGLRTFQDAGKPEASPGAHQALDEYDLDLGQGKMGNPRSLSGEGNDARVAADASRTPAAAPQGLRSTFESQPKPKAAPARAPRATSEAGALHATLPTSGRWSDANSTVRK